MYKKMITKQIWTCPEGLIEQALKEHPITGEGTVLNEPTGDFFYDQWKIKDLYKDTLWKQVLDSMPMSIGQARIIKMDPGTSYMAHADIDNRWHLNLTGEQAYLIDLDDEIMYKCERDNRWAYMDASRIHAATNYGSVPRLQLVVREPLRRSRQPVDLVSITVEPAYDQHDARFKFDKVFSPFLNRANWAYKLADFTLATFSLKFKLERELLEEFKKIITPEFKVSYETVL
jgi:hypothetical protein